MQAPAGSPVAQRAAQALIQCAEQAMALGCPCMSFILDDNSTGKRPVNRRPHKLYMATRCPAGDALFQTHENLEHMAMMEAVLGKFPEHMALAANSAARKYFVTRCAWPPVGRPPTPLCLGGSPPLKGTGDVRYLGRRNSSGWRALPVAEVVSGLDDGYAVGSASKAERFGQVARSHSRMQPCVSACGRAGAVWRRAEPGVKLVSLYLDRRAWRSRQVLMEGVNHQGGYLRVQTGPHGAELAGRRGKPAQRARGRQAAAAEAADGGAGRQVPARAPGRPAGPARAGARGCDPVLRSLAPIAPAIAPVLPATAVSLSGCKGGGFPPNYRNIAA